MTARTVTGNTVLLTGSAQASQTVTFVKRFATISGTVITQHGSTTATTDASGDFSKALDCPASGSTSWTLVTPDGSEFDFTLPYGDGSSVSVTTLISAPTVDADAVTLLLDGYEPDLGNPGTSGHVLSSTTAGVRSWVAQSGGGGASDVDDLTTLTGQPTQYLRVNNPSGLEYRDPSQVLSDIGAETAGAAATVQGNLTAHTGSTSNPHSVTASQAGALATANNLSELTATQSTARANIGAGTGNGDVTAAATFDTDNRAIRADGTSKGVQYSTVILDDNGGITLGPGSASTTSRVITLIGSTGTTLGYIDVAAGILRFVGVTNTAIFADNAEVIRVANTGRVGIKKTSPDAMLDVDQGSSTAAIPVLKLDQADVSEEFIRFVGTSANGVLTQSIVEAADVVTPTIAGYMKVFVQDDGNQLTDQAYYMPVYTLA